MKTKLYICFLFLLFPFAFTLDAFGQEDTNQLVFTKVMIDKNNSQIWLELYNPTNETIKVSNLMMSGVRSVNIIPADINEEKLTVNAGESLIICKDKKRFLENYGSRENIIEVEILKDLNTKDGIIAVNTIEGKDSEKNILRFKSNESMESKNIIYIKENRVYYKREVKENGEVSNWIKDINLTGKEGGE